MYRVKCTCGASTDDFHKLELMDRAVRKANFATVGGKFKCPKCRGILPKPMERKDERRPA